MCGGVEQERWSLELAGQLMQARVSRRPGSSAADGFQGIPGISVTTALAAASAWRETR